RWCCISWTPPPWRCYGRRPWAGWCWGWWFCSRRPASLSFFASSISKSRVGRHVFLDQLSGRRVVAVLDGLGLYPPGRRWRIRVRRAVSGLAATAGLALDTCNGQAVRAVHFVAYPIIFAPACAGGGLVVGLETRAHRSPAGTGIQSIR